MLGLTMKSDKIEFDATAIVRALGQRPRDKKRLGTDLENAWLLSRGVEVGSKGAKKKVNYVRKS